MHSEEYLNHYALTVRSILCIDCSTFKQQKLTQSALETGPVILLLLNKPSFKIHEKLKDIFC